jgi:hypothetical protein
VPRNVVTLRPRALRLPTRRNRNTRERVEQALAERFRARIDRDAARTIKIYFPRRLPSRLAKQQGTDELDRIDRRWRQLFVLYIRPSPRFGSAASKRGWAPSRDIPQRSLNAKEFFLEDLPLDRVVEGH